MKKIMLGGAILLFISVGNVAIADTTSAPASHEVPKGQIQLANADALHSTKIDNIDVPFGVLTYAHTQHLGYAVTDASKVNRGGDSFYRLTLERDLNSSEYNTIQLFYNMEWWLIDEADIPKPKPERVNENRDTNQVAPPEIVETEKPEPEPEPQKPEKPEKPEPAPKPEPKPEPSEEESSEDDTEEKPENTEARDSDESDKAE